MQSLRGFGSCSQTHLSDSNIYGVIVRAHVKDPADGGMRSEELKPYSKKRLYIWLMFCTLIIAYFFVYFHRVSVNVVGGDIIDELGGNVSFLSSIYFWTYAAMQIPAGLLADRFGPRWTSASLLAVAALGSVITAFSNDFTAVMIGKMLIAAGMAAVYIPLLKVIAVWFPKEYFPQLTGIVIAVGNLGAIAGSGPLRMIVDAVGWRETFLVLGLITMVMAALCAAVVRNGPAVNYNKGRTAEIFRGLRMVFSGGRKFWPMAISYFLIYGSIMVFQSTLSYTYFVTFYDFLWGAAWLASMIGIGKVLSTVLTGILIGRGIVKSKRLTMLYGTMGYAAVWAVLWFFAGKIEMYWFWFLICSLFGFLSGIMSLSFTQVKEWFPVSVAGASTSAMTVFLFLGASLSTTLAGFIVSKPYAMEDFSLLWGLMLISTVVALFFIYISKENMGDEPVGD